MLDSVKHLKKLQLQLLQSKNLNKQLNLPQEPPLPHNLKLKRQLQMEE
jgi:hypothetical protein